MLCKAILRGIEKGGSMNKWRPEGWQRGKDEWYRHSAHSQLLDGSVYKAGADAMLAAVCEEIEKSNLLAENYCADCGDEKAREVVQKILTPLRSEKKEA